MFIIIVLYLKIPACDILIPYLSKLPQSVVGNVKVSAQTATILKMILMVSIAALCGFKTPGIIIPGLFIVLHKGYMRFYILICILAIIKYLHVLETIKYIMRYESDSD